MSVNLVSLYINAELGLAFLLLSTLMQTLDRYCMCVVSIKYSMVPASHMKDQFWKDV